MRLQVVHLHIARRYETITRDGNNNLEKIEEPKKKKKEKYASTKSGVNLATRARDPAPSFFVDLTRLDKSPDRNSKPPRHKNARTTNWFLRIQDTGDITRRLTA